MTTATALEVCLKQARELVSEPVPPPAIHNSQTTRVSKVCKTETIRIHLGPPKFGTKTYKETVCVGVETTVSVRNVPDRPATSVQSSGGRQVANQPTQTLRNEVAGSAFFRPDPFRISPEAATIKSGTKLTLSALARTHYASASVLGEQVSVRFVPVAFRWIHDGSSTSAIPSSSPQIDLEFRAIGVHAVSAMVLFQPEFQIAGDSSWQPGDALISSTANALITVEISNPTAGPSPDVSNPNPGFLQPTPSLPPLVSRGHARLAASDCLANPKGRGCTR